MNVCYPTGMDGEFLQLIVENCPGNDPVPFWREPHSNHFTLMNHEGTGVAKGLILYDGEWQVDVAETMYAYGRLTLMKEQLEAQQEDEDETPPDMPKGATIFKIDERMAKRIQDMIKHRGMGGVGEPEVEVEEEPRRNGGYL